MLVLLLITGSDRSAGAQSIADSLICGADLPPPWADTLEIYESDFKLPPGTVLPDSADLSPWFPPAGNQGRQYACTAWAFAYGLMTFRDNFRQRYAPDKDAPVDPARAYSPAFIFNLVKQFTDTSGNCRSGIDFHKTLQLCQGTGCCTLADLPYDTASTACKDPVPAELLAKAAGHKLPVPIKLASYDPVQWKYHLAHDRPIVMFVVMDTSFINGGKRAAKEGRWFIWRHRNYKRMKGGHMIVCTGYNDRDTTFTILNSFGTDWGTEGYCKVTPRLLEYHCGAGYVFPNEDPLEVDTLDGRPADQTVYSGNSLHEKMKPGQYQIFNDIKLRMVAAREDGLHALVEFSDANSGAVVRDIEFTSGQTLGFCHNGRSVAFSYHRRSRLVSWLDRSLPFIVNEHEAVTDPFLAHEEQRWQAVRDLVR